MAVERLGLLLGCSKVICLGGDLTMPREIQKRGSTDQNNISQDYLHANSYLLVDVMFDDLQRGNLSTLSGSYLTLNMALDQSKSSK
jgi:hypothetical protein